MKKTKFIAIVLLATVVLMGAGYAYWQEDLTISNTVKTGELDLQFLPVWFLQSGDYDNISEFPDDIWDLAQSPWDFDGSDYMDVSVSGGPDNHTLHCNFTNIYPGAGGFISFKIANTGTVPARLTEIISDNVSETTVGLKDEFDYTIHSLILFRRSIFEPIRVVNDPIEATSFNDFVTKLSELMDDYTLEPGSYWELNWGDNYQERCGYNIEMPLGDSVDNTFENDTFSFDLELNFQQGE